MVSLLLLVACETSNIPPESAQFSVTVSADPAEGTYSETFVYFMSFDASSALIYIGEDAFARGTLSGCELSYQSVVVGQDTDGGSVKWQLNGRATVETADGDPCVDGEDDWAGTEWFYIVSSEDEAIPDTNEYQLFTHGTFSGFTE